MSNLNVIKLTTDRLKLDLIPELGGRINKLVFNEFHILRPFEIQSIKPLQSYKGGNFCLVPFSNRIKNSKFNFNQLELKLAKNDPPNAIHGHAYLGKWNILKKTESSAVIAYKHFANKLVSQILRFCFLLPISIVFCVDFKEFGFEIINFFRFVSTTTDFTLP